MAKTITNITTSTKNLTPTSIELTITITFSNSDNAILWAVGYDANPTILSLYNCYKLSDYTQIDSWIFVSKTEYSDTIVLKYIGYNLEAGTSYNIDAEATDTDGSSSSSPDQTIVTANYKWASINDGSDTTGDGTYDNPYQTIKKTYDNAISGDEIVLKDGIYSDTDYQINKNITIRAEHPLKATVSLDIYVTDFHWRIYTAGITFKLKDLILRNNYNANNSFVNTSSTYSPDAIIEIIGCFCYSTYSKKGILVTSQARSVIRYYKNTFRGFNKVLSGNCSSLYVTTFTWKDNIFEGNEYCVYNNMALTGQNITNIESYNCFYGNTAIYGTAGGGYVNSTSLASSDIISDPDFTSADNYPLDPSSPCINKGIQISGYVTTYLGTAPDMGCGERIGYIYVDDDNGSDTTGDGTYDNPYQTIKKAYQIMTVEGNWIVCKKGTYDIEDGFTLTKSAKITSESGYYKDVIIKPRNLIAGNNGTCWIYANTTGKTLQFYDLTIKFDKSHFVPANTNDYYLVQEDGITLNVEYVRVFFLYKNNNQDGKNPTALGRVGGTLNLKSYKCTYRDWIDVSEGSGSAIRTGGGGTGNYDVRNNIFEGCYNSVLDADLDTEDYNCFYNNTNNPTSPGAHSIVSDPEFMANYEAEIDGASPCVDGGVVIPDYITVYEGTAPDIGVTESAALSCTTLEETKLGSSEVQLNGTIDDMGGNATVEAYFEYWEDESGALHSTTAEQVVSATGAFNTYLTGLTSGTTYKYEFHIKKIDDTGDVDGGEISFTTISGIDIDTEFATEVKLTTAQINGILNDAGVGSGASFLVKVWFEYRKLGDSTWIITTKEQKDELGLFYKVLTGLTQDTVYEFRTKASRDNGTDEVVGAIITFITASTIEITTDDASAILATTATLNGTVDALGGESSIKVWFEYGESEYLGSFTTPATITQTGAVDEDISSLTANTLYYFRLCASKTDDTGVIYGEKQVFITHPDLAVTTELPTKIRKTTATLNGTLNGLGDNALVKVWFEYVEDVSGATPTLTTKLTVAEAGDFEIDVSGLTDATTYNVIAHSSKTDDTGTVEGSEKTFITGVDTYYTDDYLQNINVGEDVKDLKYDETDNCLRGVLGEGYLIQVNDENVFNMEDKSTIIALSKTNPTALCLDSDNIYVGTGSSPAEIIKLDKNGAEDEIYTLDPDRNNILCMENNTDYIYAGINTSPAYVIQMKKSDNTFQELNLGVGTSGVKDLIIVGQYIYAISGSKIYKINKVDMTLVTSYDSTEVSLSCLVYDEEAEVFYLATDTSPVNVIKFVESTSTFTTTIVYGINNAKSIILDYVYLYVGCNLGVIKLDTTLL